MRQSQHGQGKKTNKLQTPKPKKSILCSLEDLKRGEENRDSGTWHFGRCCSPLKRQMPFKLPFQVSGPLGYVLLPLKRPCLPLAHLSALPCLAPSLSPACRERQRERNTQDCGYSINPQHCTSSSANFQAISRRPNPALLHDKNDRCTPPTFSKKIIAQDLEPVCAKRTPFYTNPRLHNKLIAPAPQQLLRHAGPAHLPACWTLIIFPWLNASSRHLDQKNMTRWNLSNGCEADSRASCLPAAQESCLLLLDLRRMTSKSLKSPQLPMVKWALMYSAAFGTRHTWLLRHNFKKEWQCH